MNNIKFLTNAVQKACVCSASHVRSDTVLEKFRGATVWDGTVEVFELHGHSKAKLCYAWEDHTKGHKRFITVLGISPIDSAQKAVQAAIVRNAKSGQ